MAWMAASFSNRPWMRSREFRILTHNSTAEFGNSLGSTTNIITRSGTNKIHGALWEFLRNDAFDATNYFAKTTEPLKQNQFGATIGGPIRKDKTFFFGFYEGFRNRQGETAGSTVPSLKQRQRRFFGAVRATALTPAAFARIEIRAILRRRSTSFISCSPVRRRPLCPSTNCRPFYQSAFSESFEPISRSPTTDSMTFTSTETKRDDFNQGGLRMDHYLTANDNLNFRYMISDGTRFDPLSPAGASVPGFPVGEDHRAQNFVAQETHTFSPSTGRCLPLFILAE